MKFLIIRFQQLKIQNKQQTKIFSSILDRMKSSKKQIGKNTFILNRSRKAKFFSYANYAFVLERQRQNNFYYRCAEFRRQKCTARLTVFHQQKANGQKFLTYHQSREHNHPNNVRGILRSFLVRLNPNNSNFFVKFFFFSDNDVVTQVLHKGFMFYKHWTKLNRTFWRCTQVNAVKRCPARLCIESDVITEINEHNHERPVPV